MESIRLVLYRFAPASVVAVTLLLSCQPLPCQCRGISSIAQENFYQWPNGAIIDTAAARRRHDGHGNAHDAGEWTDVRARVYLPNGTLIGDHLAHQHRSATRPAGGDSSSGSAAAAAAKPATSPDYYSGWVEYSGYEAAGNVTHMSARFAVPPAPPHYNILTTVFLFAGLEADNRHDVNDILQPVLQYGHSGCGGGEHWSAASFYVVGITAHCGATLRVDTGDVIEANMTYGKATDLWTLTTTVLKKRRSAGGSERRPGALGRAGDSVLSVHVDHAYHWAMVTLEAIRVYSCKAYPAGNGTQFSDMVVHVDGVPVRSPPWKKTVKYTECGQAVDVVDSRTSFMHYNASTVP